MHGGDVDSHSSNQPMQLTATRTAFTFDDD
jgi:hypothetical protein